ncbi:hypothetical protein [Arthrobacter sp. MA-N2]|uniref:hypothetical protein n=1 Tax=Arthrobacter sp. MA-N2 TaxID=1101188 RepID=UPI0004877F2A|nr:hypothetical protein [Arthrobacter sp. MA-N2]
METRDTTDVYEALKTLRGQLAQLAVDGRIVMSGDILNPRHDSAQATAEALAGLDAAIKATCWMETLSTMDGDYPLLET